MASKDYTASGGCDQRGVQNWVVVSLNFLSSLQRRILRELFGSLRGITSEYAVTRVKRDVRSLRERAPNTVLG